MSNDGLHPDDMDFQTIMLDEIIGMTNHQEFSDCILNKTYVDQNYNIDSSASTTFTQCEYQNGSGSNGATKTIGCCHPDCDGHACRYHMSTTSSQPTAQATLCQNNLRQSPSHSCRYETQNSPSDYGTQHFIDQYSPFNYQNYQNQFITNSPNQFSTQNSPNQYAQSNSPSDYATLSGSLDHLSESSYHCLDSSLSYTTVKDEVPEDYISPLPPFNKWVSKYLDQQNSLCYRSQECHPAVQGNSTSFIDESHFMCRKGKRGAKNILLWKFILDQLRLENNAVIKWVDRFRGTFRFVDTLEISRKWGERKKKTDMNFEKLSRGIRHYYKSGFMSREDGTRLVYRFHWSKVPSDWRPTEVQKCFQ